MERRVDASSAPAREAPLRLPLSGRRKPGLLPVMGVVAGVFTVLCAGFGLVMLNEMIHIRDLAVQTRDTVLPQVLDRQRTAMNMERLARFGEVVYVTRDAAMRRKARLAAQVIGYETVFESNVPVRDIAQGVFAAIEAVASFRDRQEEARQAMHKATDGLDAFIRSVSLARQGWPASVRDNPHVETVLRHYGELLLVLKDAVESDDLAHVDQLHATFLDIRRKLGVLNGEMARARLPLAVGGAEVLLDKACDVFILQRGVLDNGVKAAAVWARAVEQLADISSHMSTDAAAIAANRFTDIATNADRAKAVGAASVAGAIVLAMLFGYVVYRLIFTPIMRTNHGLLQARHLRRCVPIQPARLRELDAIREGVESLGHALGRTAEYAARLETANKGLEREMAEREKVQQALAKAKEAAEAATLAKNEFLASVSHEIRTPMNAILGMADILQESPLTSDQRQCVAISRSAGELLLGLINDILDLAKAEAGKIVIDAVPFNMATLAEQAADTLAYKARGKGVALRWRVAPELPRWFVGDPVRLRQVLVNLLDNAVKFTSQGEVSLDVVPAPDTDAPGAIAFIVRDTGAGIPPDKLDAVFEAFTQADASTTREYGGTGLGLTIVKRLVGYMGGGVAVESAPGKGTAFTVRLCLRVAEPQEHHDARVRHSHATCLAPCRILVVDANPLDGMALVDMLAAYAARSEQADSTGEAVARLRQAAAANDPFGLVVVDAPDTLHALRVACGTVMPPAILCLADPRPEQTADPETPVLIKPVDRDQVGAAVRGVLASCRPPAPCAMGNPVAEAVLQRPLRVLLVEDNPSNGTLIKMFLKGAPHYIRDAPNGAVGLDLFRQDAWDIVLMDMQMPVLDGFAATEAIRAHEREHGLDPVPVLALTAHVTPAEVRRCLACGCSAYLAKPIRRDDLLRMLARLVA
ncbi:MAG: ATP-binding protein [Desulfovibrionaceae bacterium]